MVLGTDLLEGGGVYGAGCGEGDERESSQRSGGGGSLRHALHSRVGRYFLRLARIVASRAASRNDAASTGGR